MAKKRNFSCSEVYLIAESRLLRWFGTSRLSDDQLAYFTFALPKTFLPFEIKVNGFSGSPIKDALRMFYIFGYMKLGMAWKL